MGGKGVAYSPCGSGFGVIFWLFRMPDGAYIEKNKSKNREKATM